MFMWNIDILFMQNMLGYVSMIHSLLFQQSVRSLHSLRFGRDDGIRECTLLRARQKIK